MIQRMNITGLRHPALLMLLCLLSSTEAGAVPWSLPQPISDENTAVTFEVDSTWHTVHGTTSGLMGQVSRTPEGAVVVDVELPVSKLDTDNESRDEKLRRCMDEPAFPRVKLQAIDSGGRCPEADVAADERCRGELRGSLTIRDVTRAIALPFEGGWEGGRFVLQGMTSFDWSTFGVEDPSILIAKVDEVVKVHYRFALSLAPPAVGEGVPQAVP